MAKLYYGKIAPSAFAATTEAAGYLAANLGSEAILKPWRATGVGATTVTLTLPGGFISALFFHDVNFASATVEASPDGVSWFPFGTLLTYADRHGRRRGVFAINAGGVAGVRINISAGASTDGLGYWRGGSAYAYTSVLALPAPFEYGYRVRTRRPRLSSELANGMVAVAGTGPNVDRIEIDFTRLFFESVDTIIQKTTAGTCVLDAELPLYPEQQWPVRCLEADIEEAFVKKIVSTIAVPLMEIVGA